MLLGAPAGLSGQRTRLLQLDPQDTFGASLAIDRGVSGLRQRLMELRTTASVMQVTAHPDDEQSGLLTFFARGTGARTALLTLNRGEAGANASGSELFDALGLVRTEELLLADQYYGLDDQYFTGAVDYGYSKTMGEAARSWDTTAVLADMVRIIRQNQPVVVVARWYGGDRDGHGHHQLAGVLAPLAVEAAADPRRFPDQLTREGLRPWRVARLFRANLRADERADVVVEAGRYDPWLGESYASLGSDGLSRQRSQTSGRRAFGDAPSPQRLMQRTGTRVTEPDDVFSGLDTSLPALFAIVAEPEPTGARALLRSADEASRLALTALKGDAPWKVAPLLLTGLRSIRLAEAMAHGAAPHAEELLQVKEMQFERAVVAALGLTVTAIAWPGAGDGHPVVPGDTVPLQLTVTQGSPVRVVVTRATLLTPGDWPAQLTVPLVHVVAGEPWRSSLSVAVPATADPTRPPFVRDGLAQNQYAWRSASPDYAPRALAPLRVQTVVRVGDEQVTLVRTVRFRRTREPDGITFPRLVIVPPVSLRVLPAVKVVRDSGTVPSEVTVEVTGNSSVAVEAMVGVARVRGEPLTQTRSIRVARGEHRTVAFDIVFPRGVDSLTLSAFARVGDREWRDEVSSSEYRELEPTYLYAAPTSRLRRVDVVMRAGLEVGYIMGVGDLVPDAIRQLGANVTLLDPARVAAGDFSRFDALVIGTRAYAVRPELQAATPGILAYAARGGNVVVLYQTQEFRPETMAPYRAALSNDAEETTEEDAPVRLLAPAHSMLSSPNTITATDFDGWIEQRGSKFLSQLGPEYTALVETHDVGQLPQTGVWVTARVGEGQWSYIALALHRQVPYAVPGAFRILANLLSRPARG